MAHTADRRGTCRGLVGIPEGKTPLDLGIHRRIILIWIKKWDGGGMNLMDQTRLHGVRLGKWRVFCEVRVLHERICTSTYIT